MLYDTMKQLGVLYDTMKQLGVLYDTMNWQLGI